MKFKIGLVFIIIAAIVFFASASIFSGAKPESREKQNCQVIPLINEEYYPLVHKAIQEAKESVLVAMFLIQREPQPTGPVNTLLNDLIEAKKRGVTVRVILEKTKKETDSVTRNNMESYNFLKENGIEVIFDVSPNAIHTKLVVIDDRIVFVGNHNWSYGAFMLCNEASLMVKFSSPRLEYRRYFEKLIREKEKLLQPRSQKEKKN
jgi:phosphatidylserine/phosphatidylglycerophosphate/cardiolipin synthase-like enzyme